MTQAPLDAIIIADYETKSVSGSNPLRLTIDGRPASIQEILALVENNGAPAVADPDANRFSWESAWRMNGIALLDMLQKNGFTAELVNDFVRDRERFDDLARRAPGAVIISTTFIISRHGLDQLVNEVRAALPDASIFVGGTLVYNSFKLLGRYSEEGTLPPEMGDHYLFFDDCNPEIDLFITSRYGEKPLVEALHRIRNNEPLDDIDQTFRDKGPGSATAPQAETPPGRIEPIDWAAMPEELFASGVVPMQASRGCPYRCAFCSFSHDPLDQAVKPIDQIVSEMQSIALRGGRYIWFVDDIFRLGRRDLDKFCRACLDAGLDVNWMSFTRADMVSDLDFDLLKKAGCIELQIGLESADREVLQVMNKKTDPDTYLRVVRSALAAGINVSAYFIFGHPGETEESIETTIRFMQTLQFPELPGSFHWSAYPFMLVPLSPIYESEVRRQFALDGYMDTWSHKSMNHEDARKAIVRAFRALNISGSIYRGDNLVLLESLPDRKRKDFFALRHQCAQRQLTGDISSHAIAKAFRTVIDK